MKDKVIIEPNTCNNCGATVETPYCSQCGQVKITNRLSLIEVIFDFLLHVVQFDTKFIRTIRDTLIYASKAPRDYIRGKRKYYYNPVSFMLLILTIYGLIIVYARSSFEESFKAGLWKNTQQFSSEWGKTHTEKFYALQQHLWEDYMNIIMAGPFMDAFIIMFLPIYAWLIYKTFGGKKSGYNYTETLVMFLYLFSSIWLVYIIIYHTILLFVENPFSFALSYVQRIDFLPMLFYLGHFFARFYEISYWKAFKNVMWLTLWIALLLGSIFFPLVIFWTLYNYSHLLR